MLKPARALKLNRGANHIVILYEYFLYCIIIVKNKFRALLISGHDRFFLQGFSHFFFLIFTYLFFNGQVLYDDKC